MLLKTKLAQSSAYAKFSQKEESRFLEYQKICRIHYGDGYVMPIFKKLHGQKI